MKAGRQKGAYWKYYERYMGGLKQSGSNRDSESVYSHVVNMSSTA